MAALVDIIGVQLMALAKAQYDADLDESDDEAAITNDWLLNGELDDSEDDDFVPGRPATAGNQLDISRVNEADLQILLGAEDDEEEQEEDLGEQGRDRGFVPEARGYRALRRAIVQSGLTTLDA